MAATVADADKAQIQMIEEKNASGSGTDSLNIDDPQDGTPAEWTEAEEKLIM